MDNEQFLTMVAQIAHTDRDAAERASRSVLTVLGQNLTRGEAADVLRRLPEELQAYAWSSGSPYPFPPEECLRGVAEREGNDPRLICGYVRRTRGSPRRRDVSASGADARLSRCRTSHVAR